MFVVKYSCFFSVVEVDFAEFYAGYFVTIGVLIYLFWPLILSSEALDLLYVPRVLILKSNNFVH